MRSRLFVFAWLVASACTPPPAAEPALTRALLDVAYAAQHDASGRARVTAQLNAFAQRLQHDKPQPLREALRALIFEQLGFEREVSDKSLRYVFLPHVLSERRGSCVGLGALYLALAERVGLDAHGVLVPGHFFVRVNEHGSAHNVELLRRGEELPDSWYRERYPMSDPPARAYMRALSREEVIGVVEFDLGNARKARGQWPEAEQAYERAGRSFPELAEAHASAGMVAQLLGQLARARAAYQRAREANPQLEGVSQNLALLEQELAQP